MFEGEVRVIEYYKFGRTILSPATEVCLLIAFVMILAFDRKHFIIPLLVASVLIPEFQRIHVIGIDLNTMRLMVIFGMLRYMLRGFGRPFQTNRVDTCVVLESIAIVVLYSFQMRRFDALVTVVGQAFTVVGMYFVFRCYLVEFDGYEIIIRTIAAICVVLAIMMVVENHTGRNVFSLVGAPDITNIREGKVRSQGPFSHPILAGTFGAVFLPMFVALVKQDRISKAFGAAGVAAAVIMVFTSSSSGPVMSLIAGMLGLLFWTARRSMRQVRVMLVIGIILLQLNMKAPIYALVARIDVVGGSTGYFRFMLIDAFLKHAREWVVCGAMDNPAYWGWGLQDITNQYILEALKGGLISLLLFVAIIVSGFRQIGLFLQEMQSAPRKRRILVWSFGAALLSHCVTFISVSYFDQTVVAWCLLLAMVGSLPAVTKEKHPIVPRVRALRRISLGTLA